MTDSQRPDLFDKVRLPPELDAYLRSTNPWWEGKPGRVLPRFRRWAFEVLLKKLRSGLAPAVVLRGARQVGKTTLQEQAVEHLLRQGGVDARRILRVQFDEIPSLKGLREPLLAIVSWYQNRILGRTLNEAAHAGEPAGGTDGVALLSSSVFSEGKEPSRSTADAVVAHITAACSLPG
jgi:hypothetical protein